MQAETQPRMEQRQYMNVAEVIELARGFVSQELAQRDGFWGAYLGGPIGRMDRDASFPPHLEIDIRVVLESATREEIEAMRYEGLLLRCNILPSRDYLSSEALLGRPGMACHLVGSHILMDPDNRLARIQQDVSAGFAERRWVEQRVASSLESAESALETLKSASDAVEALHSLSELVLYCAATITVAHLAPPTHRRALADLRAIMGTTGEQGLYEDLVRALGADALSVRQARRILGHCLDAFDCGLAVKQQAVPFDWMLDHCARGCLESGALDLIESGAHREAILWLMRFFYVAITAVHQDGTAHDKIVHGTRLIRFLGVLGLDSAAALESRVEYCEQVLGRVRRYAAQTIAGAPRRVH